MSADAYFKEAAAALERVASTQKEPISKAAALLVEAIRIRVAGELVTPSSTLARPKPRR